MVVATQDFVKQLHDLKVFGVRLYLDDFGTGHSSLNRLHQLPIDVLKVARSFVSELDTGTGEIVRTIMTLAHGRGMQVVAEGIESLAQLAKLQIYGCDFGQGDLFSKSLTEEHATQTLQGQYEVAKNIFDDAGGPAGLFPVNG